MASQARTLIIVPCGLAKIWDRYPETGSARARFAYTGAPFKVNCEYADHFASRWVILSAKYGFLDPDDVVEGPYNVTFKRRSPPPIEPFVLREQVKVRGLDVFDDVIGLGGRAYRTVIEYAFADSRAALHFPFSGMTLGISLQAAKQAVATERPIPG